MIVTFQVSFQTFHDDFGRRGKNDHDGKGRRRFGTIRLAGAMAPAIMVLAHWFYLAAATIELLAPSMEDEDDDDDAISVSTNNTPFRNVHTRGVQVFARRNSSDLEFRPPSKMEIRRSTSRTASETDVSGRVDLWGRLSSRELYQNTSSFLRGSINADGFDNGPDQSKLGTSSMRRRQSFPSSGLMNQEMSSLSLCSSKHKEESIQPTIPLSCPGKSILVRKNDDNPSAVGNGDMKNIPAGVYVLDSPTTSWTSSNGNLLTQNTHNKGDQEDETVNHAVENSPSSPFPGIEQSNRQHDNTNTELLATTQTSSPDQEVVGQINSPFHVLKECNEYTTRNQNKDSPATTLERRSLF